MQIKVNLPHPYEMNPEQFFAQMRISLKAAEKAYQEVLKNLTEQEKKDCEIWLNVELTELEATKEGREKLDEIDPNNEERQSIAITINRL